MQRATEICWRLVGKFQQKYNTVKRKWNFIFGFKMNSILNMFKIQELKLSVTE